MKDGSFLFGDAGVMNSFLNGRWRMASFTERYYTRGHELSVLTWFSGSFPRAKRNS